LYTYVPHVPFFLFSSPVHFPPPSTKKKVTRCVIGVAPCRDRIIYGKGSLAHMSLEHMLIQ
jgi:hypothetical protein